MKILCLIILTILMYATTVFTSNRIRIQTTTTTAGDTGKFSIIMENDLIINGLQFTLQYEPSYIIPIKINTKNNAGLLTGSTASLFGENKIAFLVYDQGFNFINSDSTIIFDVEYIVKDSISQSSITNLIFTESLVVDPNYNSIKFEFIDAQILLDPFVGINEVATSLPTKFELFQNYPNPFNPNTIIKFEVPRKGNVQLIIYDILGCEIATLVNEELLAGWYERIFNSTNLASGVYIYRMKAEGFVDSKKMILLK